MKMVKSLLLGAAAGIVAVAGAQAADLPVKAKPVQYVKICSLYGAGFWYIPGTDTCIKLGGFMRYEIATGAGGSFGPFLTGANARFDRGSRETTQRTRAVMSFDIRSQTAYGTLRAYLRFGAQWTSGDEYTSAPNAAFFDRGFIQLAGFTFGRTASFFDIYNPAPTESYQTNFIGSATGGSGITVAGYTAQFGNGLSATISAEDRGGKAIYNVDGAAPAIGTTLTNSQNGGSFSPQWPDIVANLRVDQAWGSAGISGAIHNVSSNYYGASLTTGHPDDKVGFAIGGGAVFNLPMLGKGDKIGFEVDYARGAGMYTNYNLTTSGGVGVFDGQSVALGWHPDAVFSGTTAATGTSLELTKSWAVVAGYSHHWLPNLQTSIYGGYLKVSPSDRLCDAVIGVVVSGGTACDPDWSLWQVGSRTIWNPVENLDVGLEVMYSHVKTSFDGGTTLVAAGARPAGAVVDDNNVWSGIFRVQRNFWP
ncbi:MAG: porin [Acidobacteriota bacterium]